LNIQYKKGVLELCLLSLLKKRDFYGYEISEYLSKHINIADGTVYPILRKLKSEGLLATYIQKERVAYLKFARAIETLLEGKEND